MKKTILVADDDRNIIDLLKQSLSAEGYNVVVAYDGRTALDLIKLYKPDLAILDVMMPNIDGFSLEFEAREKEEFKRIVGLGRLFLRINALTSPPVSSASKLSV
jgi:DNA-binding response OmpR family regulator